MLVVRFASRSGTTLGTPGARATWFPRVEGEGSRSRPPTSRSILGASPVRSARTLPALRSLQLAGGNDAIRSLRHRSGTRRRSGTHTEQLLHVAPIQRSTQLTFTLLRSEKAISRRKAKVVTAADRLRGLQLEGEYRSDERNLGTDLFVPCLSVSSSHMTAQSATPPAPVSWSLLGGWRHSSR